MHKTYYLLRWKLVFPRGRSPNVRWSLMSPNSIFYGQIYFSPRNIHFLVFFIFHVKRWNQNFYLHSQKSDLKCFVNQVRIFWSYTAKARPQFWKQENLCGEDKAKETPETKGGFIWSITSLTHFQVTIYQNKMRFKSLTKGIFTNRVLGYTPT